MKFTKIILYVILIFLSHISMAQEFKWASDFGNTSSNRVDDLAVKIAANGDYVITGILEGTIDFDLGSTVVNVKASYRDVFIAKYSSTGNLIWVKLLKGTGNYESYDPNLNIDKDGNIIICMTSDDTVDFDPSIGGTYNLSSAYNYTTAAYLAKYDGNGNYIWAKKYDTDTDMYPQCIETDSEGNIYLTGDYYYSQDFNFTSAIYTVQGSSQVQSVFLAKYSPSADFIFAERVVNASDGAGVEVMKLINNTELVLGGGYSGYAYFDPSTTSSHFFISPVSSGYVSKYKTDGTFVCANSIDSDDEATVYDLTVDSDGNIYAVGDFNENIDFNGKATIGQEIVAHDPYDPDGFIVKYTSQAQVIWYFSIGAEDYDHCVGVAISSKNNLVVTGTYTGTVDFDPVLSNYANLDDVGAPAGFVASYTLDKKYLSAAQLTFSTTTDVLLQSMEMNASDQFLISGILYSTTDVDPSSNVATLNAGNIQLISFVSVYGLADTDTSIPVTTASLSQSANSNSLKAYPNPVTDNVVYITGDANALSNEVPTVLTVEGKIIPVTYTNEQGTITIDVTNLSKGIYFIAVGNNNIKIIR